MSFQSLFTRDNRATGCRSSVNWLRDILHDTFILTAIAYLVNRLQISKRRRLPHCSVWKRGKQLLSCRSATLPARISNTRSSSSASKKTRGGPFTKRSPSLICTFLIRKTFQKMYDMLSDTSHVCYSKHRYSSIYRKNARESGYWQLYFGGRVVAYRQGVTLPARFR